MEFDVTQLSLEDKSIIVLRGAPDLATGYEMLMSISRALRKAGFKNCCLVQLGPGEDLTVLDDEGLDRMGLKRKEPK